MLLCLAPLRPLLADSRSNVMETTATTSATAPCITLNWTNKQPTLPTQIYRRVKGATVWEAPVNLPSGIYTYADMTAQPGVAYEYSMSPQSFSSIGGIVAGHNVPLVESRGKVILLVDQTMVAPLSAEIQQLEKNLVADGWVVLRHDVPRETVDPSNNDSSVWAARIAEQQNIRAIVQADYNTDPGNTWALLLFGRIPVPYSGNSAIDGHGDHGGAWPADSYYADVDGNWTDANVSTGTSNFADQRNVNKIGDGKFDTNTLPSDVEIQCGRVDLTKMSAVPRGMTEVELLRQYLVRDNRFRRVQAPFNNVARRGIVDDNFNYYAQTAWISGFGFFGRDPGQMDAADWFTVLPTTPMLFAYGCGGGLFYGANGVGESEWNFGRQDSKAVFTQLFGSYFGDWDSEQNFLRAPLAGTNGSLGLSCAWSGRGQIPLYHMALGDTVGYSTRKAINNGAGTGDFFQSGPYRGTHIALMGDPTLRLHSIAPPSRVTATSSGAGVVVRWQASTDFGLSGYHVYRSMNSAGPFIRITGTAANGANPTGSCLNTSTLTFTDNDSTLTAGVSYTYLVKAVRMESTPSGTYANQSIGEFVTTTHLAAAPSPGAPTQLSVRRSGGSTFLLTWEDNSDNETGFLIERYNAATGLWSQIGTVGTNATSYTDSSAPSGQIVNYRVRATNANGSSGYSDAGADQSLPGIAYGQGFYRVVNKDAGVFSLGINRFNGDAGNVSLSYSTAGIWGTAGLDYPTTTGTVSWANGESGYKPVNLSLPNPSGKQMTKIFQVNLGNPTNGLGLGWELNPYVFVNDPTAQTLPSPWASATFGSISDAGYAEQVDGTFGLAVRSGPIVLLQTSDSGRFLYRPVTGDFTFSARVTNYPLNAIYGANSACAGIALRGSLDARRWTC